MKDYYKILGIPPSATQPEIKKAYRALAVRYHPDKNNGSTLAEAQFKEIQEAYATLGDAAKRAKYDDERWLMGMGGKTRYEEAVTPKWLLNISIELNTSLATMDTHRMSQRALQAYILLILTDAHLGVLQQWNDRETNNDMIQQLLSATRRLEVQYLDEIAERLTIVAAGDDAMLALINDYTYERARTARQQRLLPYFVLFITLALCLLMYVYAGLR